MTQKAYAEGMRALVLYTASVQDEIAGRTEAERRGRQPAEHALNDLLLPIVKGYGSEKSYEQLAQSLQTFGGSGYLQEYPIEQYIRDAKIDTLYEGTTAIQGQDFFFRKIVRDQGEALNALAEEIKKFLARRHRRRGAGRRPRARWPRPPSTWRPSSARCSPTSPPPSRTSRTSTRWASTPPACCSPPATWSSATCCCKGAAVAAEKLETRLRARTWPSTTGKIAAAKFFAANVLPGVAAARARSPRASTLDLMELDEAAF